MRVTLIAFLAATLLAAGCRDSKTSGLIDAAAKDSGPPMGDGGPQPDADLTPGGRIAEAKAAADGAVDITIESALITYLKPSVGDEGEGFFVQAVAEGPALFIAVNPDGLSPNPQVGDEVTFTITEMGSASGGLRQAVVIGDYDRLSAGNSVEDFVQVVTNASDLVTALNGYDSELIELEATITGDFGFGGNGHRRAAIATVGVPETENLAVRIPEALEGALSLTPGCSFKLRGVMWRFTDTAQPSGWVAEDFSNVSCAAPQVVSAVAASDTSVIVTLDRPVDGTSVVADGSQFTITPTLATSAATADGNQITVTTAAQTEGLPYTIEVADTVTDIAGTGVDPGANSADFDGFRPLATVVINELNPNIDLGCDLVEVRALAAGAIGGVELWARDVSLYTLPEMSLAAGDFVIIHLGSLTNCNTTGAVDETIAKASAPAATHPQNFDAAFDLYTASGGLTATSNVITLVAPAGTILDAVLIHNDNANVAGTSEARAAVVADAGEWTDTSGMVPAGGFVDADFVAHGVPGSQASGTDATGASIQRVDDDDDNDKSDWTAAPAANTWADRNSGQSTP